MVVPVGKQLVTGWVVDTASAYTGPVKNILGIIQEDFIPDPRYLSFARSVGDHFLSSLGMILDYSLSPKRKGIKNLVLDLDGKAKKINAIPFSELKTMAAEKPLSLRIKSTDAMVEQEALSAEPSQRGAVRKNRVYLSYSRLEEYRKIVSLYLGRGESVMILVPDFLTAQYLSNLLPECDIYHTESGIKGRDIIWNKYQQGRVGVVIGGLTAAFLPMRNLGCIIQERVNKYFGSRSYTSILPGEVADIRAAAYNIPAIWGGATFSVKMFSQKNKLEVTDLRPSEKTTLHVGMIKPGEKGIPPRVLEILKSEFLAGKKVLVVVNKKESTDFLFCPSCNRIQKCPYCRGSLILPTEGAAACQRCKYTMPDTKVCPKCSKQMSVIHDLSISVLKRVLSREIVEAGICTLAASDIKSTEETLVKISQANIVVATPAIINPFFKDQFAAIIYLKPESAFNMNEYHAAEMIFATIAELREMVMIGGKIHLFSAFHFHYAIKFANDEEKFFQRELKYRKWFRLPPYARVYKVEVKDRDLRRLGQKLRDIYPVLQQRTTVGRLYLLSRKPVRGIFRGILEVHGCGEDILATALMQRRDINVSLLIG